HTYLALFRENGVDSRRRSSPLPERLLGG
ncbi:TPA_asm: hypothetical protein, partial [ssRNA phage SRR5466365_2]